MSDPREPELLEQLRERDARIKEQDLQLERLREELRRAQIEIDLLKQKVDMLARRFFGKKSEQLDANELQLLFDQLFSSDPAATPEAAVEVIPPLPARPALTPLRPALERKPRLPEHLPVVEETIVPAQVQATPEQWKRIGEEITERLDYTPGRFTRLRTIRPKYVPRVVAEDAKPIIAELPPCILERSILTAGLLAQILVAKYCDHLPLYRQESIYRSRHGVEISRQTMAQWVGVGADWLRLIYEQIRDDVMSCHYLQVDETPIRYLAPGHGKTKLGYLWTCHRPGAGTIYFWHPSRAAACLETIVPAHFCGHIQCDGYRAYDAFAAGHQNIELAGCWAHVRRKFYDAFAAQNSKAAALILHLIQHLYRIEAKLRKARAGPTERARVRGVESRPLIQQLHRILLVWKSKRRFLPKSLMGQAIRYALSEWDSLLLYIKYGVIEIDNNLVENAVRPTALGKKNWLFFGEAEAGHRGAVLYTVIESCRRHGIDPYEYLRDIFTRLPSATNWQVKDLTPAAWAKARQADALQIAA